MEVSPPSKRVGTIEDEGVEQMQPTALNSEKITITGEAALEYVLWCTCTCVLELYLNHIPTVCICVRVPLTTPDQFGVCGCTCL